MKNKNVFACVGTSLLGALLMSSPVFAAGALPAAGTPTVLPALATPAAPAASLPALPAVNSTAQTLSSAAVSGQGALPGLDGLKANSIRPIRGPGYLPVQIPIPALDSPTTKAQRRS